MPSATPQNDPAVAHPASNSTNPPSASPTTLPATMAQPNLGNVQIPGLDQNQLMSLLRQLPGVFKFSESPQGGALKEDAAQTLSSLAQAPAIPQVGQLPVGMNQNFSASAGLRVSDPGPASHPRGPPNLSALSAVAAHAAGIPHLGSNGEGSGSDGPSAGEKHNTSAGRARGRNPAIGTDEWTRQRKDNHKEVERRRRGNINEGINELGRIVPNMSGEKAKGAILARAVQYILHLKENEARNIEKWTLEKLLMDQAMGDLQAQLEEVKRLWDEERNARQRAETELEVLRSLHGVSAASKAQSAPVASANGEAGSTEGSNKRRSEDDSAEGEERSDKKARTE